MILCRVDGTFIKKEAISKWRTHMNQSVTSDVDATVDLMDQVARMTEVPRDISESYELDREIGAVSKEKQVLRDVSSKLLEVEKDAGELRSGTRFGISTISWMGSDVASRHEPRGARDFKCCHPSLSGGEMLEGYLSLRFLIRRVRKALSQ